MTKKDIISAITDYVNKNWPEQIARDVEKYFLDLGLDGGTGGGKNINYVYCFLQNSHTRR